VDEFASVEKYSMRYRLYLNEIRLVRHQGDRIYLKYMEPVMRAGNARAQAQNRDVVFLPDCHRWCDDEFHKQPTYATLPMLCEWRYRMWLIIIVNSGVRVITRFTVGWSEPNAPAGVKVISWRWTIKELLELPDHGKFDGFIFLIIRRMSSTIFTPCS